ncbi:hypothetical protein BH11BAC4_BH11BAC4_22810 [soil metagenome]
MLVSMKQNYSNYKQYYSPHHFIFLPLMGILTGIGIKNGITDKLHSLEWFLFSILSFCILYLAIMLRQHYALGNQNRIVRLEFRLRYFELLSFSSKEIETRLSFSQIAALRFADDDEFKELIQRAVNEGLPADSIKKAIRNWQADDMRV